MMVGQARPPKSSEVVSLFGSQTDEQHALALLRHHVGQVGKGEALSNATFAINGDDLGFLFHLTRVNGIRLNRGFRLQLLGICQEIVIEGVHCKLLQSSTIFQATGV